MFDPVLKDISDRYSDQVVDVLRQIVGFRAHGQVEIIQPNIPQGTLEVDRVYRLSEPYPSLWHTEWESSSSLARPDRFHVYNTLLTRQTGLPVKTVVVLLRPVAHSSDMTGVLTRNVPEEEPYLIWRYSVVRLWELPVELFLQSPGTTPFAALAVRSPAELPELADRMEHQWKKVDERAARDLRSFSELWLGMRFDPDLIHALFEEKTMIKESSIYKEILQEGKEAGKQEGIREGQALGKLAYARDFILRIGQMNVGPADGKVQSTIENCTDQNRLDRMLTKLFKAHSWEEVLAEE